MPIPVLSSCGEVRNRTCMNKQEDIKIQLLCNIFITECPANDVLCDSKLQRGCGKCVRPEERDLQCSDRRCSTFHSP